MRRMSQDWENEGLTVRWELIKMGSLKDSRCQHCEILEALFRLVLIENRERTSRMSQPA